MSALQLLVTTAGLDALVDAQNGDTDPIVIAEIGLSAQNFVMAPTLTALPGEFKRLDNVSGQSASETIIHLVASDTSTDVYTVRSIGLFLSDGTLFAVYAQADPIVTKVSIANFLIAQDIAFLNAVDVAIDFGDATFLYPPATETTQGVAEIATNGEADAGVDDQRIMTPAKVKRVLDALAATLTAAQAAYQTAIDAAWAAFQATVNAAIMALQGRTITGGGLATGGGDLTANRVITVAAASAGDFASGTGAGVVTAALLSSLARSMAQSGYCTLPGTGGLILQWGRFTSVSNGTASVTFPVAFPNACHVVVTDGGLSEASAQDNYIAVLAGTISATGFSAFNGKGSAYGCTFIAIGH
jgi:hypothetical protein